MSYPDPGAELPRLCFLSYRQIREFAVPVIAEYTGRAQIEVVDGTFGGALAIARDRVERGLADAFVSAGSNASILRAGLQAPVATIQLTGFDILQALIRARSIADRVGVVMYGQPIPELDAVKDLLSIEIVQHAYQTPDDARQRFEQLRREGFRVIVGSSLVVEFAEQAGLQGLLAYSLASVRKGFEDALELARVARLEAGRYEQLNGVLHSLQDAVLAVDRNHRIIAVNPPMQKLLERDAGALVGRPLDLLPPELSLRATLDAGHQESAGLLRLGGSDWIANRTAIRERGAIVGAALTLYEAGRIHEADTSLRVQQRRRQNTARHRFGELIGQSPGFIRAMQTARRYAHTDMTVLISGESGVGKELFAQAIHNESRRADRPFVAVNCASFPETLLESELFGYEEGAFTGSRRGGKRGLFEAAHTGTLFLDEIGDMPLALQSHLLRVLQEREVTRLGATAAIPVDVRVIAATHQPLRDMVAQRRFRQDLYYRINTLQLEIPALRERPEDIPSLLRMRVARAMEQLGSRLDAADLLAPWLPRMQSYAWPGNVRELENISERIAVFLMQYARPEDVDYGALRHDCPELFEGGAEPGPGDARTPRERALEALRISGGNRREAARRLGVSRSTLWRWANSPEPPSF
ncbi:propionate catabolism operon regulatory protein PrpR [Parapusillimonas granuli]|uniref:Propionate catabolism operon regulatory protein PrpR n=1 Tax=Parapusillimonas granuli TaxID=380911 RepID=A0A853FWX3_9BURK|nr:propionate catabolism operon regulatory protein PrpR [Parapusillimonas granuli]MBB5215007.1 propionate catabolism operon transcriptional regulator [Parapusillimonas granuli]MEB2401139.1 propionate catabolism operon regulatory protein PrpR [Alcaligenaceae bacterium]NYT49328.1 propionate catabolism operon regulatory protein PrpR [Parapusillimonas granuli]